MLEPIYDSRMYYEERSKQLADVYLHGKADQDLVVRKTRQALNWIGDQLVVCGEWLIANTENPQPHF